MLVSLRSCRGSSSRGDVLFVGRRTVISFSTTVLLLLLQLLLVLLLLVVVVGGGQKGVNATNPYSSNVIALTSSNWKEIVLDNPHSVFVNICRIG
jgi:hypothetical protein